MLPQSPGLAIAQIELRFCSTLLVAEVVVRFRPNPMTLSRKSDTPTRNGSPANKGRSYPAEILTPAEMASLLRACSGTAPTGLRNRALIVVLYRAGLRITEALSLFPKDLDPVAGTVTVLRGKGGKRRTVGLDPQGFSVVERWLDRRAQRALNGRHPVFCTLDGRKVSSAYVRGLLPRLARKAGIEKRVHAHGLRHTHAAELAREGVPMNVIQQQLGHTSLATTSRYLAHVAPTELIAAIRGRTWDGPEHA